MTTGAWLIKHSAYWLQQWSWGNHFFYVKSHYCYEQRVLKIYTIQGTIKLLNLHVRCPQKNCSFVFNPTALCECKNGQLVCVEAFILRNEQLEQTVGKPCKVSKFWAELIKPTFLFHMSGSTDITFRTVILFCSCEELNVRVVSMLNLLDITSKFGNITVFLTVDLQTVFYPYCVDMFMVCLYTSRIMVYRLQTESKRKYSCRVHVLLFTTPPPKKKKYLNEGCSITTHYFRTLTQMLLVFLPSHNFAHPSCFYWL
jgi:hypothetical protein